jgi:hypothetical protein
MLMMALFTRHLSTVKYRCSHITFLAQSTGTPPTLFFAKCPNDDTKVRSCCPVSVTHWEPPQAAVAAAQRCEPVDSSSSPHLLYKNKAERPSVFIRNIITQSSRSSFMIWRFWTVGCNFRIFSAVKSSSPNCVGLNVSRKLFWAS